MGPTETLEQIRDLLAQYAQAVVALGQKTTYEQEYPGGPESMGEPEAPYVYPEEFEAANEPYVYPEDWQGPQGAPYVYPEEWETSIPPMLPEEERKGTHSTFPPEEMVPETERLDPWDMAFPNQESEREAGGNTLEQAIARLTEVIEDLSEKVDRMGAVGSKGPARVEEDRPGNQVARQWPHGTFARNGPRLRP